ncbi:hypothetical protein D7V82_14755 [bacterium 1xD8-6]|nr:hypothetical protein D7V72_15875 [bacterium D16-36]RKI66574.1 hypothetical protein D7V82_14755 [bacterium 1xD8-6]
MTNFTKTKLTDAGISFLSREGVTINFTRIETGCGLYIPDENIGRMESLKAKVQDIEINDITRESDSVVAIEFNVSNKNLKEPYLFTEIGIYADDPDKGEVLYGVCFSTQEEAEKVRAFNGYFASVLRIALRLHVSPDSVVICQSLGESVIVIDNALSETSKHAVENRVITKEFKKYAKGEGLEFSVVNGILNVTYDDGEEES